MVVNLIDKLFGGVVFGKLYVIFLCRLGILIKVWWIFKVFFDNGKIDIN